MTQEHPTTYQRKPRVVMAHRITSDPNTARRAAQWCGGRYEYEAKASDPTDVAFWVTIPTVNPTKLIARSGQFIVRDGETGEYSVRDEKDFLAEFETPPPTPRSGGFEEIFGMKRRGV